MNFLLLDCEKQCFYLSVSIHSIVSEIANARAYMYWGYGRDGHLAGGSWEETGGTLYLYLTSSTGYTVPPCTRHLWVGACLLRGGKSS